MNDWTEKQASRMIKGEDFEIVCTTDEDAFSVEVWRPKEDHERVLNIEGNAPSSLEGRTFADKFVQFLFENPQAIPPVLITDEDDALDDVIDDEDEDDEDDEDDEEDDEDEDGDQEVT